MDLVYNFLKSLDLNNSKIVLGVSSGPDSMCLLNILSDLKEKYNFSIPDLLHRKSINASSDEE